MKKVIENGKKDEMIFKCKLCSCVWSDDEWHVKDEINRFNSMMFFTTRTMVQLPTSTCPHCGWTSQDLHKEEK